MRDNETFCFRAWLVVTIISAIWCYRSGVSRADEWRQALPIKQKQAICRVVNGEYRGTGTLIGRDDRSGLVITCNHILQDEQRRTRINHLQVVFHNGEVCKAQVLGQDHINDISALLISRPNIEPVPLANYRPQMGEMLFSAGLGGENSLAGGWGQVSLIGDLGDGSNSTVVKQGGCRNGDSGGPIFNSRGELAAVLWGGYPTETHGTSSQRAVVMLKGWCRQGVCQPRYVMEQQQPVYQQPTYQPQQPPQGQPQPNTNDAPNIGTTAQQPVGKSCECNPQELADLKAIVTNANARITVLEGAAKQPGPAGPQGPPGERGPAGAPGISLPPLPAPSTPSVDRPTSDQDADDQPVYWDITPRPPTTRVQ